MMLLFVVWGAFVGIVIGTIWIEISMRTRMSVWADSRDFIVETLPVVVPVYMLIQSFFLAAYSAGFGYAQFGWVSGVALPVASALAGILVVESLWSGIPILLTFFANRIVRFADASLEATRAFHRSWTKSASN